MSSVFLQVCAFGIPHTSKVVGSLTQLFLVGRLKRRNGLRTHPQNDSKIELEVLLYKSLHVRARNHFRVPSSCKFEFVQADPKHPAEQHRNIANNSDLKRVDYLIWRKDGKKDNLQLATKGGNGITKSSPIVQSAPYKVKVMYKGMFYRFTVARGKLEFSFEELRSRTHGLLNLPTAAQFTLSYIDADQHNITMGDHNDLKDAKVVQSLQPLRVNILMVEENNSLDGIPTLLTSKKIRCRYLISSTRR